MNNITTYKLESPISKFLIASGFWFVLCLLVVLLVLYSVLVTYGTIKIGNYFLSHHYVL